MSDPLKRSAFGVSILEKLGRDAKIVLLRGGGFGDFLSITAALRALRAAAPGAEITLITSPAIAPLARRYEELNRVTVAPAYPDVIHGNPNRSATSRFFLDMRREQGGTVPADCPATGGA